MEDLEEIDKNIELIIKLNIEQHNRFNVLTWLDRNMLYTKINKDVDRRRSKLEHIRKSILNRLDNLNAIENAGDGYHIFTIETQHSLSIGNWSDIVDNYNDSLEEYISDQSQLKRIQDLTEDNFNLSNKLMKFNMIYSIGGMIVGGIITYLIGKFL